MRRRVLERALQRLVADQELRVGLLLERDVLDVRQQHLREHDRGRALGRHRHARIAGTGPRHELDRVDRALGGDAHARQDRSDAAWRAYSIDEIGARSSWPSSSIRFSSVGTP